MKILKKEEHFDFDCFNIEPSSQNYQKLFFVNFQDQIVRCRKKLADNNAQSFLTHILNLFQHFNTMNELQTE
jgi:hypothetical protein